MVIFSYFNSNTMKPSHSILIFIFRIFSFSRQSHRIFPLSFFVISLWFAGALTSTIWQVAFYPSLHPPNSLVFPEQASQSGFQNQRVFYTYLFWTASSLIICLIICLLGRTWFVCLISTVSLFLFFRAYLNISFQ